MNSTAFQQNFPIRNRIISVGVLVVEGRAVQRSAITAKLARDQGCQVFAIPGNITSKPSWGPNLLIKHGPNSQDWNDVIAELPAESRRHLIEKTRSRLRGGESASEPVTQASLIRDPQLDGAALKAFHALPVDSPVHLDDLLEKLKDISPSELIAARFELEMLGLVKQLLGKNFVKVW